MLRRTTIAVVAAACAAAGLSACSGKVGAGAGGSGSDGMIASLTFPADAPTTIGGLVNYNPFAPTPLTSTWLYEPLMVRNGLSCDVTPWLATAYKWDGATKLTFTIRDGVKFSDGKPLTAQDVAFTFNLGKKYPAVDKAGLWNDTFGAPAKSVTAQGNQVVMEFTGPAAAKFDDIIKAPIVPEHVYGPAGDPTKFIDKNPAGTGPMKVKTYNGRRLVLERRADYWQADKIHVKQLVLEGQYDASQASLKLRSGQLDAYWGEIPNPQRAFVSADPKHNHFYYAPNGTTVLTQNLKQKPFSDVKFRAAMAPALNRQEMSDKATYGIMKPASQTGLKLPVMDKLLPDTYQGKDTVTAYDPAQANQMLDAAGYKKGPDGKRSNPDGSPINLTFSVQAGFIDYQAMADVIARDYNAVGIPTKVVASAPDSVDAQKKSGDFQMMFEYLNGGCTIATNLGSKLATNQIPKPDTILPNVQRWSDPATDKLVAELGATTDPAQEKSYVGQLVDTMMTKLPVTSLLYAPTRIIYRTDKAVGWPSEQDPYAHPTDNRLLILTHLRPAQG